MTTTPRSSRPASCPDASLDVRLVDGILSDAELGAALEGGVPGVVEMIYRKHARHCQSVAQKILRDAGWAADVTQEVFLDLSRLVHRYETSKGSLRAWLTSIAHNKAVDRARWLKARAGLDTRIDGFDAPDAEVGPADAAVLSDQMARIHAALDALPPSQRDVLLLAYLHGHTHAEIAALTGCPLGTVKYRCRAGVKRLGELLVDL